MVIKPYIIERDTMSKLEKKSLSSYSFEGCVTTLVGAYSTFNPNATKKQVDDYRAMVEAYTIDEMNEAVYNLGFKVKVRKNANYFKLPKFAQKLYDSIKNLVCVVECKDGQLLEIGVYIKTPTSKRPVVIPYKKGRSLDKN